MPLYSTYRKKVRMGHADCKRENIGQMILLLQNTDHDGITMREIAYALGVTLRDR